MSNSKTATINLLLGGSAVCMFLAGGAVLFGNEEVKEDLALLCLSGSAVFTIPALYVASRKS